MLTARGFWVLMAGSFLAIVGVTSGVSHPALLGLTILAWFIGEWILFAARARFGLTELVIERTVIQSGRPVASGWAKQPFRVQCRVVNRSRWRCPYITAKDCNSMQRSALARTDSTSGVLPPGGALECTYTLSPAEPGMLRFAGVNIRMSDLNGFFRATAFRPAVQTIAVLTALTDDEGRQRANKRFNALPPPGTHRLRMPGAGSELLDLRDYRAGDPPKMIAWKASARRDRLITKEYESDVPVRCLLMIDSANSVRIGPTEDTILARFATTAAGVLLAATANRDLVGSVLFDAQTSSSIAPARSKAHVIRLLDQLARNTAKLPEVPETDPHVLIQLLDPRMRERAPELFDSFGNSRPLGLYWKPLLDSRYGWLIFLPFLATPLLAVQPGWLNLSARLARALNPGTGQLFIDFPVFMSAFLALWLIPSVAAVLIWLAFGLRGFWPGVRRNTSRRKQISAAFAALDGGTAVGVERYQFDDDEFARRAGRFFSEAGLRIPPRLIGADGLPRFREPAKIDVVAKAIVRATARARDNELYVVFADVLHLIDDVTPLLRAVRLARSRHHHVMVILPWPDGVSLEREPFEEAKSLSLKESMERIIAAETWSNFDIFRRRLIQAGATVLRLRGHDTVRSVLAALDRLRGARSRR